MLVDVTQCPNGYVYIDGDILGATIQGGINASLVECAKKCSKNPYCKSFEHENNHCNINKESVPNGPRYQNFIFCSKEGTR